MKHKALAIFDTLVKRFFSIEKPALIPTIYASRYAIDVIPKYDGEKICYLTLSIYDMEMGKPNVMEFTINTHGGMMVADEFYLLDVRFPQAVFIEHLLVSLELAEQFKTPITVKELPPFPENCNPFRFDHDRMGADISKNLMVMFNSRPDGPPDELILINTKTGRRFELDIYEAMKYLTTEGENECLTNEATSST